MAVIEAKGTGALQSAREMLQKKSITVYSTRSAPKNVLTAKLRAGGINTDVTIGKTNNQKFPVGTRVFDTSSGDVGIVVGTEQRAGFKGRLEGARLIVRTGAGRADVLYRTPKSLNILAEARPRGWADRTFISNIAGGKTNGKSGKTKKTTAQKKTGRSMFRTRR
jgi:hypothetical protein|tara:strand:- start:7812 stop:8306 length:495 start_codon:yes stop_codon:yes gene_type:complete